jgi:hypothetical protein
MLAAGNDESHCVIGCTHRARLLTAEHESRHHHHGAVHCALSQWQQLRRVRELGERAQRCGTRQRRRPQQMTYKLHRPQPHC